MDLWRFRFCEKRPWGATRPHLTGGQTVQKNKFQTNNIGLDRVVVPLPLHSSRRREAGSRRRFTTAPLLAKTGSWIASSLHSSQRHWKIKTGCLLD